MCRIKSTVRLSRPSFSVPRYIFHCFYYCLSRTWIQDGEKKKKKKKMNDAAGLLIKENN